jgi:methyl-accepting chemotaxis protein
VYIGTFIGVLVIASLLLWLFTRSITLPLKRLSRNASSIADGNLTVDPVFIRSKDEIGELGRAFNGMLENLKLIILNVRQTNEQVALGSDSIHRGVDENRRAGEEVAQATQVISEELHTQNEHINQSVINFENMFETFKGTVEKSGQIKHHANQSLALAEHGNQTIDEFLEQFLGMADRVEQVYMETHQLQQLAEEMTTVLKSIKGIAKETSILSINASIEASRESSGGKSFSVIAERIKELAKQSGVFAEAVEEKIQLVRYRVYTIHEQMKTSVDEIAIGKSKAELSKKAFYEIRQGNAEVQLEVERIISDLNRSSDHMSNIRGSISDIEHRSSLIKNEIASIAAMGEEQLATLEEVTSTSDSLIESTDMMSMIVKQFKL